MSGIALAAVALGLAIGGLLFVSRFRVDHGPVSLRVGDRLALQAPPDSTRIDPSS